MKKTTKQERGGEIMKKWYRIEYQLLSEVGKREIQSIFEITEDRRYAISQATRWTLQDLSPKAPAPNRLAFIERHTADSAKRIWDIAKGAKE